jgi:uncharacterized protein
MPTRSRKAKAVDGLFDDSEISLTEIVALDAPASERFGMRITPSGYLVAEPRIARTGIQLYKGSEVGRPDMEQVRVYRPETEVFDKRAMASLAHRPVTLDHPDIAVDASNWKKHAVGHSTGDVARDGEFVRVPLTLMDQAAIDAARSGKSQLSVGYGAKLRWEPGETSDGQIYDAMQTEIRANHIALVSQARGGPRLQIGDSNRKENAMTERVINLDGVNIQLEDRDGQVLERHLKKLDEKFIADQETAEELKKKIAELQARLKELEKTGDTKDGEIIGLTKKLADAEWTPAKIDEAVRNRLELFERARRALGDKLVTDGKTDAEIKREVVVAEIGDEEAQAMSDEAIAGVFRAVTRETKKDDGLRRTADALSRPLPTMNPSQMAHQKYVERLANAHKQKTA